MVDHDCLIDGAMLLKETGLLRPAIEGCAPSDPPATISDGVVEAEGVYMDGFSRPGLPAFGEEVFARGPPERVMVVELRRWLRRCAAPAAGEKLRDIYKQSLVGDNTTTLT